MRPMRSIDRAHAVGWLFLAFILFGACVGFGGVAAAEPATATTADLESLLQTIEDPAARERLAAQLRALIEARQANEGPAEEAGILKAIAGTADRVLDSIGDATATLGTLPQSLAATARSLGEPGTLRTLGRSLVAVAAVLGAGGAVFIAVALPLGRYRARRRAVPPTTLALRALRALGGLVLDLVTLAAAAAAGYLALLAIQAGPQARLAAIAAAGALLAAGIARAIGRAVLAPDSAVERLLPLDDESAIYWKVWLLRFTGVAAAGGGALLLARALDLSRGWVWLGERALGGILLGMGVVLLLQNRHAIAHAIRGRSHGVERRVRDRIAEVWHIVAVVYALLVFAIWAGDVRGGFQFVIRASAITVLVLTLSRLGATIAGSGLRRLFAVRADLAARLPTIEARVNRYVPILATGAATLIYSVGAVVVLQAWGIDTMVWLASADGRVLLTQIMTVVIVIGGAMVVHEVIAFLTETYLIRIERDGRTPSGRLRTVLPLVRKVATVVIGTLVVLTVLSSLGLNIAPLLAGAGVVGLAVGFGAQSLVKDVITGLFILVEDTVAIGDVVDLGGHAGVVESLSIRAIRLRDLAGSVHTVPFGEVTSVINMTKDFSYALFDISVSYDEDTDRVVEVLKETSESLRQDPDFASDILDPMEVLGVDQFADSAIVIKARIRTRPIRQWRVAREYNRRLKKRFDAAGITIPYPHRTVVATWARDGATGAAAEAILKAGAATD